MIPQNPADTDGRESHLTGKREKQNDELEEVFDFFINGISKSGKPIGGILNKKEAKDLEERAREKGIWLEDYRSVYGKKHDAQGVESFVYLDKEGRNVIKINNGIYHSDWGSFFSRIKAHNLYSPETFYEIIGYTKRDGRLAVVLKQPLIRFTRGASWDEVKTDLALRGFTPKTFRSALDEYNGVFFRDLHDQNAIVGENGNIYYIDALIQFEENKEKVKKKNPLQNEYHLKKQKENLEAVSKRTPISRVDFQRMAINGGFS